MAKLFNKDGKGSEELRFATGSFYANADFGKIEGIVGTVERELSRLIGSEAFESIVTTYEDGEPSELVRAAQRVVGYMATMRYFRLNDISHETDGRKVKMDSENERRPFEWQLERDDEMHLQEYYNALDCLVNLLMDDEGFRKSELYGHIAQLLIPNAESVTWLTGVETSPYLYLRLVPFLTDAQRYVAKRLGDTDTDDEELRTLRDQAIAHRALALFVRKTEMKALPGGAFREAVSGGGRSKSNTTTQLHDYYEHMIDASEEYIHEMQHRRDELLGTDGRAHLIMPENDVRNKFFRF